MIVAIKISLIKLAANACSSSAGSQFDEGHLEAVLCRQYRIAWRAKDATAAIPADIGIVVLVEQVVDHQPQVELLGRAITDLPDINRYECCYPT